MKGRVMEAGGKIVRNSSFFVGVFAGAFIACTGVLLMDAGLADARQSTQVAVKTLFSTSQTIIGEPIAYPVDVPAKVTAAIVSLPEGASTGWHRHGVPLFAYLLDGELTIDYGSHGTRIYRAGDTFMEAKDVAHNGRNAGVGDVRILAVYLAAEGLMLSHEAEPEKSGQ